MEEINKKINLKKKKGSYSRSNSLSCGVFSPILSSKLARAMLVGLFFIMVAALIANAGEVRVRNGDLNVTGDLIVDYNTLYINSTSNKVGIGMKNPSNTLLINGTFSIINSTNSQGLFQDTNGFIGINQANPTAKLELKSIAVNSDLFKFTASDGSRLGRFVETSGGYGWFEIDDNTAVAKIVFRADGGANYISVGNTGIGTTNPSQTLHVNGTFLIVNNTGSTGLFQDSRARVGIGTTSPQQELNIIGDLNLSGDLLVNNGNVLFVNATNNMVGIGTSSPDKLLQIQGADSLSFTPGNSTIGIDLRNKATSSLPARQVDIGFRGSDDRSTGRYAAITGVVTGSSASGQIGSLIFSTKASVSDTSLTERMRITNAGKVGINDSTPSTALDVGGAVRADSFIEYSDIFKGDALAVISNMKSEDGSSGEWQPLDHTSLPSSVIVIYEEPVLVDGVPTGQNKTVYGRSINNMMDINTRAIEQLLERIEVLEAEVASLKSGQ